MGRMGKKSSHLLLIFSFFFFNTIKGSHPGGASLRLLREAWKKLKNGSWEKKKSAFQTNSSLVSPGGLLRWGQRPVS